MAAPQEFAPGAIDGNVAALTRGSSEQLAALSSAGITPIVGDWLEPGSDWSAPEVRSALVAVPHRADERFGQRTHCVGLETLLAKLPQLERLVVLSTTGVYQQGDGQWVDETSPTNPTRIGPQIALAAEQWLRDNLPSGRATALRLAGIYGPGRVPLIAKLRSSEPIPTGEGYLNLIHVVDIARAIVRLFAHRQPSHLYALSDGQPVERRTFYQDAARIFKTPPPQFVSPEAGSARAQRSESSKRVCPQRIMDDLQLELSYPDHLSGLSAIAAAGL